MISDVVEFFFGDGSPIKFIEEYCSENYFFLCQCRYPKPLLISLGLDYYLLTLFDFELDF